MANPLAIFRKYEKILLVVFGVALIIVFTVGGIVSQYMGQGPAGGGDQVVVKLKSEELRESDVQNLLFARYHLRNFMRTINMYAAERGATPKRGLGIPDTDAEADLVQTAILSQQAREMGMQISDQAIIDFLTLYTQDKIKPTEFAGILQSVTQNRMSQDKFFDAMRRELLAQRFVSVFQRGILPPTPAGAWDFFLRLNRRVNLEAVPFKVEDYLARADEPTEAQIEALYEDGKDRYPMPDRSEPGFKHLKKVAIQYVKADLSEYMPAAKASITDDQVAEYYESNKEEFRNISLPSFGGLTSPGAPQDVATSTTDETEVDVELIESELSELDERPPADVDDLETDEDTSDLPDAQPVQETPTESDAEIDSVPEDELDGGAEALETEDAEAEGNETSDSSSPTDTIDVALSEEEEVADVVEADHATDSLEVDEEVDEEIDPLADLPVEAGNNAEGARPEFEPLEEVSDDIRTRLAAPVARQEMDRALSAARALMRSYMGTYFSWDVSADRDATPQPTPPDLLSLAQQHGMTVHSTPLVNVFELQKTDLISGEAIYEISRAYDTNYVPFAQEAFKDNLGVFEVHSIRGQVLDTEFLYWKTAEVAESVPDLKDARAAVVRSLKMQQALEFAKNEAQAAVEGLNRSGQSPGEAYVSDPNRRVIQADSVTWMTSMNVPYLPPRLSRIPGIEFAGEEFMRPVFSLEPGQAGTAVNNPKDTVYVVSVTGVESDDQQLRDQFIRDGMTQEAAMLAQRGSQRQLQEWYATLEKDLGVEWQRDPTPDSRSR